MGAWVFRRKGRTGMYTYTRPNAATYVDANGETKTAPPNQARLNHDTEGNFLGMKFGDGDTMTIPLVDNAVWRQEGVPGTLIVEAQAPTGVEIFRCGTQSIFGDDAMKTYVVQLTAQDVLDMVNTMTFFPNEDDVSGDCHLRIAKYYADTIILPEEYDMMVELNTFMHGAWY